MELIPQNPTKMNCQLSDCLAVLAADKKAHPSGKLFCNKIRGEASNFIHYWINVNLPLLPSASILI